MFFVAVLGIIFPLLMSVHQTAFELHSINLNKLLSSLLITIAIQGHMKYYIFIAITI